MRDQLADNFEIRNSKLDTEKTTAESGERFAATRSVVSCSRLLVLPRYLTPFFFHLGSAFPRINRGAVLSKVLERLI